MRGRQIPWSAQRPKSPKLPLVVLAQALAICRLPADAPIPPWSTAATSFFTLSRTKDELSIVAEANVVPADVKCDRDYRAFKVEGPLPLNLVGILASIANPLADAKLAIFAISTYDTDYVLVKGKDLEAAIAALTRAGHRVHQL